MIPSALSPGYGGLKRLAVPLAAAVLAVLLPCRSTAIRITNVTVDHDPGGGGPWITGVTPGTPMYPGDLVRVNLTVENDTGLLGDAAVDLAAVPPSPTAVTADPVDCAPNNDGGSGSWPSQYWVWPYSPGPIETCGYYPGAAQAPLSLVSAAPILTFDYNGYTYAAGSPSQTATVSWVFRIEQAGCAIDLDVFAIDQDDDGIGTCIVRSPAEGSWRNASCALQGDGSAHHVLAARWGGTLCVTLPVSVAASAVVMSSGTRPAGVAYLGDKIEVRADATNTSASAVTVNPGDACLSVSAGASVCVLHHDAKGACSTGRESGSPALPVTINPGNTVRFAWTESVAGSGICAGAGCSVGGVGSGAAVWTATIAKALGSAGMTVQAAPIAITCTVWVDPDGAGATYTPVPLGVVTAGTNNAGPYYYMGAETIETRFTYRNTSAQSFEIAPIVAQGSMATGMTLVAGPVPALPQTLGPGASVTVAWTWARKPGGVLDDCANGPYGMDFTTAVRGNCLTQPVQARDVPFRPYDVCGGGCPAGSRNLTFVVPSNVDTGGVIAVSLHATNPDNRPFVLDVPPAALWVLKTPVTGDATLVSSPPGPPYAWNAGEMVPFTWTYSASTAGTVRFCAGLDFLSVTAPCHPACAEAPPYCGDLYGLVTISTPGALTITGFTATPPVSCADGSAGPVVLSMNLANSGPDCVKVTGFCSLGYPDPWPTGYAWDAASPASPSPAVPFTIPAGGTQLVTWYMSTVCPDPTGGLLSFDCKAPADMVKGEVVNCGDGTTISPVVANLTVATTPPPVTVTQPAFLSASIWTDKAQYSTGQTITVFFSVSNQGGNAVDAFSASLAPNLFSGAVLTAPAGPVPVPPLSYPGTGSCSTSPPYNAVETFVWQYTAGVNGFASFTGTAKGTDGACGLPISVSLTTPKVPISSGAGLDCQVLGSPVPVVTMAADCPGCTPVSQCDPVTGAGCYDVVVAASNLGGIDLANVMVTEGGSGLLQPCSPPCAGGTATVACPQPDCEPAEATTPGTIAAGSTRNFLWRFSPTGLGCLRPHVQVSGFDGATGAPLAESPWGPCARILPRYPVEMSLVSAPARVAPGQKFTVTVHACNPGATVAALQGGQPALQFVLAGSPVSDQYDSVPPPAAQIAVGACVDIPVEVTVHRDATPGDVTIRLPQGTIYVAVDSVTGLPVRAVDKGAALTVRVSDPRSRLFVTGSHPAHVIREPVTLEYVLADAGRGGGRITLRIYTLAGELVRTLVDKPAAIEDAVAPWDGRNASGQLCASGVYLARMEAPGFSATVKVAILK